MGDCSFFACWNSRANRQQLKCKRERERESATQMYVHVLNVWMRKGKRNRVWVRLSFTNTEKSFVLCGFKILTFTSLKCEHNFTTHHYILLRPHMMVEQQQQQQPSRSEVTLMLGLKLMEMYKKATAAITEAHNNYMWNETIWNSVLFMSLASNDIP